MAALVRRAAALGLSSAPAVLLPARGIATGASPRHWFKDVDLAPKDPILGVTEKFLADTSPSKMNLGVGAYRDNASKPLVLACVRAAESRIAGLGLHEYLPMGGLQKFCDISTDLVFGPSKPAHLAAIQTLSGTGAVRVFADFQSRYLPKGSQIWISNPTWSNHHSIFADAHVPEKVYRYWDPVTRGLDLTGMLEDLSHAKPGDAVLLHACAHNPTGVDPTPAQWAQISAAVKAAGVFPLFDSAYQGFASGDLDRDAAAVRRFVADGHAVAVAQSYAKNLGLYGQRVGCLSVACFSAAEAEAVGSQLKRIARPMYSSPPLHGAALAYEVLSDAGLRAQWEKELKAMADRIIAMRVGLRDALESTGSSLPWNHVTDQIGMFAYSGMTGSQVDALAAEHHIYMTRNGRISMAGVTSSTLGPLAKAMHAVTAKKA